MTTPNTGSSEPTSASGQKSNPTQTASVNAQDITRVVDLLKSGAQQADRINAALGNKHQLFDEAQLKQANDFAQQLQTIKNTTIQIDTSKLTNLQSQLKVTVDPSNVGGAVKASVADSVDGVTDLAKEKLEQAKRAAAELKSKFYDNFGWEAARIIEDLPEHLQRAAKGLLISLDSKTMIESAQNVGLIMGAELYKGLVEKTAEKTRLEGAEKIFLPVQQAALQTRVSFGEIGKDFTLDNVFDDTERFTKGIAIASMATNKDIASMVQVTKQLSQAMGVAAAEFGGMEGKEFASGVKLSEDNVRGFNELTKYYNLVTKSGKDAADSISQATAAQLLGNATGMDSVQIAGMINKDMTQLRATEKDSLENINQMAELGRKSGLGMVAVSDSIMKTASSMKMWGGTVSAAAPVFDMFVSGLERGQKGLAPELYEKFASGINNMSVAQRAFLGMQSGMGMGAGGAIGAGLELEAALEKGPEGMQKVMDSLTGMLKEQAGGRIITRQEAIDDPQLQNMFLMQRKLISSMTGMTEAESTKTLEILSKTGGTLGATMTDEEKQRELFKSLEIGMGIGERTTSEVTKAGLRADQAYLSAAPDLIRTLRGVDEQSADLLGGINTLNDTMKSGIVVGKLDLTTLLDGKKVSDKKAEEPLKAAENIVDSIDSAATDAASVLKKAVVTVAEQLVKETQNTTIAPKVLDEPHTLTIKPRIVKLSNDKFSLEIDLKLEELIRDTVKDIVAGK